MTYIKGQEFDRTSFGEIGTAESRPFIQAAPSYGLVPANFREFTSGTGTTGVEGKKFKVTTGVGVGGYGAIQSFRALNYKPGEGGHWRGAGYFTAGVASSWQGIGLLNLSDEMSFGYNGVDFGIWHRHGGYAEVRTIQVTGGASGSENLTLTLNGVAHTIPLTAGSVQHNAYEIETWLNANQSVFNADQLDDSVIISAASDGAKSGTYSFSSSTATGSITQNTAGVTKTSDFVAQADWNVDNLSGWSTPLDPTMGNVYQIKYQYLGMGAISYFVANPLTGDFVKVHVVRWQNANTDTNLTNPSMHVGLYCVSLGSTTDLSVYCSSIAGFVQGVEGKTRNPRSFESTQTITNSAFTNILTIRNRRTYNGFINQVEVEPLLVTISNEGTKTARVEIRGNQTTSGEENFQVEGSNLVVDVDTTAYTMDDSGRKLLSFSVAGGQSIDVNLDTLRIRIPPSLKLCVSAKLNSGASAPVNASLNWYEDI